MPTHVHSRSWSRAGENLTGTATITADGEINADVDLTALQANLLVSFPIDQSDSKSLYVVSTVNATIKTNSSSSPTQTITLIKNEPLAWYVGAGYANPITADVTTGLFVTNLEDATGTVKIRYLEDLTP